MNVYITGNLKHSQYKYIPDDLLYQKLADADTWFLDCETTHELDTTDLFNQFLADKNVTEAVINKANKYVAEKCKEIAVDPKRNIIRLLQIEANNEVFLIDAYTVNIEPIMKMLPTKYVCGYNLKFDLSTFYNKFKVYPYQVLDLWLTYLLIEHSRTVGRFYSGLGVALENHLDIKVDKGEQTSDWQGDLTESQLDYACKDVLYLRKLASKHIQYLNRHSMNTVDKPYFKHLKDFISILEMKFLKSVMLMEYYGIPINLHNLYNKLRDLEPKLIELDKYFESIDVNYNSPQQVVNYLNSIGIKVQSSAKGELVHFKDKPEVAKIMEAKKIAKEITTITDYINKWQRNGRIYPTFWQLTAKSGRLSSSNPNAQQIPRDVKGIIYGDNIITLDYPAIEMRIMAEVTKDPIMIKAFKEGIDIHKLTATSITGKPMYEITKDERQGAKASNFLLLYGGGAETFKASAFIQYGIKYTSEQAQRIRQTFLNTYKNIASFHRMNNNILQNHGGQVCSTIGGRRMFSNSFTLSNNLPIQGTGADMLKLACVKFYEMIEPEIARIVSVVHDEVIVEYTEGNKELAMKTLKESMEYGANYFIKSFNVDVDFD